MFLQEKFGLKYPFIQGGMAHVATGAFAGAVSKAGGLGIIGSGGMKAAELRDHIHTAKSITDKPFGVNLMLLSPECDEMAKIIVEEGVPLVTTGAGNPSKYMEAWKAAGVLVFPVVPNPSLGQRMEKYGADALIAEGMEAGGHIGNMTTMTLIPQLKEVVDIPVIAAGGIASGRQMLAAEVLGADGFQLGTAFLATEECPIHDDFKDKVISAKSSNITVIGDISGLPNRLIKNQMTIEYLKKEREGASKEELELLNLGALRRAVHEGDVLTGSLMAGLVVGQINEVKPVEKMMDDMYKEYMELKNHGY